MRSESRLPSKCVINILLSTRRPNHPSQGISRAYHLHSFQSKYSISSASRAVILILASSPMFWKLRPQVLECACRALAEFSRFRNTHARAPLVPENRVKLCWNVRDAYRNKPEQKQALREYIIAYCRKKSFFKHRRVKGVLRIRL